MAERYRNAVQFFVIYIREAHPSEDRQAPQNVRERILLPSAKSQKQKEEHAELCVTKLDIRFPTLVDKLDNKVELAYAGWPDRLYLIGRDGRVVYKSGVGPKGFIPSELENAIKRILAKK